MTDLADIFAELGISHYLNDFLEQGFDTWDTILDITESDFDALGVKLGHRRKLQRKIANSRGLSSDRALASPRNTPSEDRPEEQKAISTKAEAKDGAVAGAGPHGAKRKYRRHPKPDENAPERPPSAYVIFSNKMREELKGRNLSFTEIAKLVGENWQNLSPGEKEPYEQQAFSAKEKYNNQLAEYKKTDRYKEYSQYLADFKARHSNTQQGASAEASTETEAVKRPKLEAHTSTHSSGGSSCASQQGDSSAGRPRVGSSASNNAQWHMPEGHTSLQVTIMPRLNVALGVSKDQGSPSHTSPTMLPGYRESIYGVPPQSLPWRDGHRDDTHQQLPRLASIDDRRHSQASSISVGDSINLTGSQQHAHRTGQGHPPPTLRSESTNKSTSSSASTGSSAYFTPRTPMEPPLERALPMPSLYSQKNFESQLAPLRPPSLSPQATVFGSQASPNGVHIMADYPASMPPMRGYGPGPQHNGHDQADPRYRDIMNSTYSDDNLDPVSALIRAGEIVNQNSRDR